MWKLVEFRVDWCWARIWWCMMVMVEMGTVPGSWTGFCHNIAKIRLFCLVLPIRISSTVLKICTKEWLHMNVGFMLNLLYVWDRHRIMRLATAPLYWKSSTQHATCKGSMTLSLTHALLFSTRDSAWTDPIRIPGWCYTRFEGTKVCIQANSAQLWKAKIAVQLDRIKEWLWIHVWLITTRFIPTVWWHSWVQAPEDPLHNLESMIDFGTITPILSMLQQSVTISQEEYYVRFEYHFPAYQLYTI